jgi:putative DNA primase/helicase
MGAMKELDLLRRIRIDEGQSGTTFGDLSDIANTLGGEVDGRTVRVPSPGHTADDRSCHVRIDPARPGAFFIYDCEGPKRAAYAAVRAKLHLIEPHIAPSAERSAAALRIWGETIPAAGTIVERYLRSRAITLQPPPPALRFHPALRHTPTGGTWPAIVALVTRGGIPCAVHRTYLDGGGRGKAPIQPDRMSLGPIGGGVVRLAGSTDGLMIGEGIETCLSAMQATGRPAWSALSAVGLRSLDLPLSVREITILADGDDAGEAAARVAAARWISDGRRVRIARAPTGKDFNDVLIEEFSA